MTNVNSENIFIAGKTHKVGKSGYPGNDCAAPTVVAQKRWRRQTTGSDRLSNYRTVVVTVVVIDRGFDGGGRAKVPDGLPGVRWRGEPVRRPVGRRGRRHQKEADVAPGLVRGQNEARRRGRGHGTTATAATVSSCQRQLFVAPSIRPIVSGGGCIGRGRVGPDAERSAAVAIATRRFDTPDQPDRPATHYTTDAAESRLSPDECVHRGTRPAYATGCRRPVAFRVLRRTGRVVDKLVG